MSLRLAITGAKREFKRMNRELKKIDRDVNTAAFRAKNRAIQGVHTGSVRALAAYYAVPQRSIRKFLKRFPARSLKAEAAVWLGSTALTKTAGRNPRDGKPLVVGRSPNKQKAPAHQTAFNVPGKKPQFLRETKSSLPIGVAGIQQFDQSKRIIMPILRVNGVRLFNKEFKRQLRLLRGSR